MNVIRRVAFQVKLIWIKQLFLFYISVRLTENWVHIRNISLVDLALLKTFFPNRLLSAWQCYQGD